MKTRQLINLTKVVFSGLLFLLAVLIFFISLEKRRLIFKPKAISKIETKVQTICSDSGNALIEVKVANNEDKAVTVIATDIQTGNSVDLGKIGSGDKDGAFIKTGKSNLNSGTVKFFVEWEDKSSNSTLESNYSEINCSAQPSRSKIRPILASDCQNDTWTITGYDPSFPLDQVDKFMIEIDGKTYDSLFPTGTWRGKKEIFFWIHVFLKNGDRYVMDADIEKTCQPLTTPTPTPTVEASPSPTPTAEASPTPTLTPTPTELPTNTPTPLPTATLSPTVTPTLPPGVTPTLTPTSSSTPTLATSSTPAASNTPTPSEIILAQATSTPAPQATTVAQVTEIPPAGVATFGKIFAVISAAVIILSLIF